MKSNQITWIIVGVVLLLFAFNGCSTYNGLVTKSEEVDKEMGNLQAQYQRRFDLIPNLVATVKGYAEHEKSTYENVTRARAGLESVVDAAKELQGADISNEADFQKYTQAQSQLNKQLSLYVNAVHEAYPDLKANENFRDLQVQLEGTENRINTARVDYNKVVMEYNVKLRRFPASLWAGIFGFQAKPQYAASEEAQSAPKVEF